MFIFVFMHALKLYLPIRYILWIVLVLLKKLLSKNGILIIKCILMNFEAFLMSKQTVVHVFTKGKWISMEIHT